MKMFPDKNKPLSTCDDVSCSGCDVRERITCHFNAFLLKRFLAVAVPCFIIGGIGICLLNVLLIIPWIIFFILYFGLIEIRVMCSHCPHYAEPGTKSLQCWANYGSPKLWKYRPGPMNLTEKIIFFAGLVIIFLYPAAVMAVSKQFILLAVFVLYTVTGFYFMLNYMCKKCMNFACPFNGVTQETRDAFLKHSIKICNARNRKGH